MSEQARPNDDLASAIAEADRQRARADSNGHARDVARAELDRVRGLAGRYAVEAEEGNGYGAACSVHSDDLLAILDSPAGDAAQRRSEEEGREGVDRVGEPHRATSAASRHVLGEEDEPE